MASFTTAPFQLVESDLVLTIAERVARTYATQLGLEIMRPPVSLTGFQLSIAWHRRHHHDPASRWLRECILDVCADL